MTNTNIDYWNKILQNPKPIYKELFAKEDKYLINHISKDSSVLDIGCGNGRNIETLLSLTKNITGIDIEESAVKESREKFKGIPEITIAKADVLDLPFPENSFDVVTLMLTLVNFNNKKTEALREMKRVVKDNGKLIMSVYSEEALENRLKQYEEVGVPVKEVSNTKVVFGNPDVVSEQFSLSDIEEFGKEIGMKVENVEKVPGIAYIFEFTY